MKDNERVKDITSTVGYILGCIVLVMAGLFCLGWFTGCSGDSGTSASSETYTKKVCDYEVVRQSYTELAYDYDISPAVQAYFGKVPYMPILNGDAYGWSLKRYVAQLKDNFIKVDTFHIRGLYTKDELIGQLPTVSQIGSQADTLVRTYFNGLDQVTVDFIVDSIYRFAEGIPLMDTAMRWDYSASRRAKDKSELRRMFGDTIPKVYWSANVYELSCEDVSYVVEKDTTQFCYETQVGFQYVTSNTHLYEQYFDRWVKETCLEWAGDECAKFNPDGKIYITRCKDYETKDPTAEPSRLVCDGRDCRME